MQSENNEHEQAELAQQAKQVEPELSDAWRELLGLTEEAAASAETDTGTDALPGGLLESAVGAEIPTLTNDPWTELQREQDIEIVDLQRIHSQALDDLDLEQALQFMQEQPAPGGQEK